MSDCKRNLGRLWAAVFAGTVAGGGAPCLGQWKVVILHPPGYAHSWIHAGIAGKQVGSVLENGLERAGLWRDSAESFVLLHAPGAHESAATGVADDYEFGWTRGFPGWPNLGAALWRGGSSTVVHLTPAGLYGSHGWGAAGEYQVGTSHTGGYDRASVWSGTPESEVDVTPAWASWAWVWATDGRHFAGYTALNYGPHHATLWRSTDPDSAQDLHPIGVSLNSSASCVHGEQVGGQTWSIIDFRACLWNGSSEAFVDLHPALTTTSGLYGTTGRWQAGAVAPANAAGPHAVIWNGTRESVESLHAYLPAVYYGSNAAGLYEDGDRLVVFGSARSPGGSHAALWIGRPCWANCDGSTTAPVLNAADFGCFLQRFAAADWRANCDGSTIEPVLNAGDFLCFVQRFATGCPW